MLFLFVFFVPETYAPFLLKARAKKLRQEQGNDNIRTEQELFRRPLSDLLQESLVRPFGKSASPAFNSAGIALCSSSYAQSSS